jgi:superfamily II DNA helicase RecQ
VVVNLYVTNSCILSEGTAIVVSPLIALMKNQVDAINGISAEEGVGHVLNSSLNKTKPNKFLMTSKAENQATLCSSRKFSKRRIS